MYNCHCYFLALLLHLLNRKSFIDNDGGIYNVRYSNVYNVLHPWRHGSSLVIESTDSMIGKYILKIDILHEVRMWLKKYTNKRSRVL